MSESGKLYLVGTPIGNLSDFSPRAVETLSNVDFIAAEDTRVSLRLLTHFGIQKPLISYFEHNAHRKGTEIISRISGGESCAIITDAGMPCISDPGEDIVRLCAESGIEVVSVPSATAFATAVAMSGLPTSRFSFEGFLSMEKKPRLAQLEQAARYNGTLIFYEAPHKLKNTLADMLKTFGDRKVSLCRELTKIHEEVLRGTLSEMAAYYEKENPRGEYVIVIEGRQTTEENNSLTLEQAVKAVGQLINDGKKQSEACKEIAQLSGFSKSELYKAVLDAENNE